MIKRYENIVNELVGTEEAFVNDLTTCKEVSVTYFLFYKKKNFLFNQLINNFLKLYSPLVENKIINESERDILFHNQDKVLELNNTICKSLQSESKKQSSEHDFGSIFVRFAPSLLSVYSPYCSNLVLSRRLRTKLTTNRDSFRKFLEEAQNNPKSNKQDLKSYLIKPLQRFVFLYI